jgi:SulP family sulfate permease
MGFHSTADYPEAAVVPGLLLYRFNASLVFFNVDRFCARLRHAVRAAPTPVRWVIVDLSPVSYIDATALQRFDELREELRAAGVTLGVAHAKRQLRRAFDPWWVEEWRAVAPTPVFPTLRAAVQAFDGQSPGQGATVAGSAGVEA